MTLVAQILQDKGRAIYSTTPDATVYQALEQMAQYDVGALLVLDGKSLVGILSERDYARKIILKGKTSKETFVREIMTEDVVGVSPQQTIEQCMALMTAKRVRHLPVIDRGELIGVISIGDVVKSLIADQQFLIEELEKYVTGVGA